MIALDTNVLVRFLVRDNEKQAQLVYSRFKRAEAERERFFVPLLVVLELVWVLDSAYEFSRNEILDSIKNLTRMSILEFEGNSALQKAMTAAGNHKADLSDFLIACSAEASGCAPVFTFDKKAARFPLFRMLA